MARERARRISRSRCCARTNSVPISAFACRFVGWQWRNNESGGAVERPWSAAPASPLTQTGSILRPACRAAVPECDGNRGILRFRNAPGTKHAESAPGSVLPFHARYQPPPVRRTHAARRGRPREPDVDKGLTAPALREGASNHGPAKKPGPAWKGRRLLVQYPTGFPSGTQRTMSFA